jgi:hypothetical protein
MRKITGVKERKRSVELERILETKRDYIERILSLKERVKLLQNII